MPNTTTGTLPRIFVVEDNPADIYLLRTALEEHGVRGDVMVVQHGDRAMELLQRSSPDRPNLILMDLNLPGKSGLELLGQVRSIPEYDDVPVVVMTSSSAPSDRQAAERLGVSYYFRKPTHLDGFLELGSIVKNLL